MDIAQNNFHDFLKNSGGDVTVVTQDDTYIRETLPKKDFDAQLVQHGGEALTKEEYYWMFDQFSNLSSPYARYDPHRDIDTIRCDRRSMCWDCFEDMERYSGYSDEELKARFDFHGQDLDLQEFLEKYRNPRCEKCPERPPCLDDQPCPFCEAEVDKYLLYEESDEFKKLYQDHLDSLRQVQEEKTQLLEFLNRKNVFASHFENRDMASFLHNFWWMITQRNAKRVDGKPMPKINFYHKGYRKYTNFAME